MLWALTLCLAAATSHGANVYEVTYTGTFVPNLGHVRMQIDITQEHGELRQLNLRAPTAAYANFAGSGKISRKGSRLLWQVPRTGER